MKQEIISSEVINPSKQTPPDCKTYKLSMLDQLSPSIYSPILLFYQAPNSILIPHENTNVLSNRLKASLSETLTYYYVFAGRIKDNVCVECNDEGVPFLEAWIKNKKLAEILSDQPKLQDLNVLFPNDLAWKSSKGSSLLAIQVSYFECKGFSIGICISHKVADGCTVFNFLKDWASLTQQRTRENLFNVDPIKPLLFDTKTTLHHPLCDQYVIPEVEIEEANHNVVTARYVFSPTNISKLKSRVLIHNPTRVEVVTSFLYKTILEANKKIQSHLSRSHVLVNMVNLRSRLIPPLPRNSAGNIIWCFGVMMEVDKDIEEVNLASLVTKMREGFRQLCDFTRKTKRKDWLSMVIKCRKNVGDNNNVVRVTYKSSSLCNNDVYEIDFGWGKPLWVTIAGNMSNNSISLMDSKDGEGIEAWVTLDQNVMDIFQSDEEFMKFASYNPNIIGKMVTGVEPKIFDHLSKM